MGFIGLLNWKVQGARIASGMTQSRGTKMLSNLYLLYCSVLFSTLGLIFQSVFSESGDVTWGSSDSPPHSLPSPIERGFLFPTSTRQSLRIYLTRSSWITYSCLNQIHWPGWWNACSSLVLKVTRSTLLQTTGSKMRKVLSPQREIRVFLPEDRRILTGPAKLIDIHHTHPDQCFLLTVDPTEPFCQGWPFLLWLYALSGKLLGIGMPVF